MAFSPLLDRTSPLAPAEPDAVDGVQVGGVLGRLLGPQVTAAECWGPKRDFDVHAAESELVLDAGEKRRRDFLCGRTLARLALACHGEGARPLLRNADRSPIWPPSITGSITHTNGYCAAVVAPRTELRSIGIDAEEIGAVTRDLWKLVFTPSEREILARLDPAERDAAATLVFSAKEAYFKCQHPITGVWLDFGQVEVSWAPELRIATEVGVCARAMNDAHGEFWVGEALAITAFTLPQRD